MCERLLGRTNMQEIEIHMACRHGRNIHYPSTLTDDSDASTPPTPLDRYSPHLKALCASDSSPLRRHASEFDL